MTSVFGRPSRLGFLFLALFLFGCGESELKKNKTYPAEGKILINGEPAAFVMVYLWPTDPKQGAEATGVTGEDGTFQLRTYANEDFDGAVPGKYTVTLEAYHPGESVGVTLPAGAKPTQLSEKALQAKIPVEIKAENNDLEINVP